jgi:hypothetical protein
MKTQNLHVPTQSIAGLIDAAEAIWEADDEKIDTETGKVSSISTTAS